MIERPMGGLYNTPEMAAGYARSRPAVHPHIIERVRRHLGLTGPVERALDVGCGVGLSTRPLQALARHCAGIDPVEAMLKWSALAAPAACFTAGAAEAIPVRSNSMDIVTAAGSLNYAELSLFFPEAARVLGPRGVLVVYDFGEGRRFPESAILGQWYSEFQRRYPPPAGASRDLSPETLESSGREFGFRLSGREDFQIGLTLSPGLYLDYVMTETNVSHAVRNGAVRGEIRAWCSETLAAVFRGDPHEVLFGGYIAYMVVNRGGL